MSLARSAEDLAGRGFTILSRAEHEVRARRRRFHPELFTSVEVWIWLRRVDEVDLETVLADREAMARWVEETQESRFRTRMTVLGYHARRSTPEARAHVLRGPSMGFGRFDGVGIADGSGVHVFRGVRLVGWGFYPLMNFVVATTLAPRSEAEPRTPWVWGLVAAVGLLPVVVVLGRIAWVLLRARGVWGP